MGKVLVGIFLLWVLWSLGSLVVDKIRNSLEDKAIRKARVKESFDETTQGIVKRVDLQIAHSKDAVSEFREMAYEKLPGLEDRIARHGRQQEYIRFILPYKKKNSKGRR